MPATIATFQPPYLRYDKPSELLQIQAQVQALRKKALAYQRQFELTGDLLAPNIGQIFTESPPTSTPPGKTPAVRRTQVLNLSAVEGAGNASTAGNLSANVKAKETGTAQGLSPITAGKAAGLSVTVSPSGTLVMGFNCQAKFHATNNFGRKFTYWTMFFKDPVTGLFTTHGQFLGPTYFPNAPADEIDFGIIGSTYSEPAYMSADGKARFKITCESTFHQESATSDEVVLNFNAPPCIGLHSVSLNENTFVGKENGNDPTMTVVLDAPAPPGGQRVYLSLSKTDKAGILGNKFFDIPAGQTSGAISGFLGTEKVLSNQSFDILVDAGGPITGHAKIYLHKKPKK